jgi:quinol monooxygenase YgiN
VLPGPVSNKKAIWEEYVKVILHLTARPETIEALKTVLLRVAEQSRTEQSCISYQVLQDPAAPCNFTLVEDWASEAAIDHHMSLSHTQQAFAEGVPLLAREFDMRRLVEVS